MISGAWPGSCTVGISAMTLGRILTDQQDELLREERQVLGRLRAAMADRKSVV